MLKDNPYFLMVIVFLTCCSFVFGYAMHKPADVIKTETFQVEKVVTPAEMIKDDNLFICSYYKEDKAPSGCRKYQGEAVVDGVKYYKAKYYDSNSAELVLADKYSKLYYIQQTEIKPAGRVK